MTLHKINNKKSDRIRQGDIFSNIPYYESYFENKGEFELSVFEFPYVVVLTQDCDLNINKLERDKIDKNQNQNINDKYLISIIVAPLYNAQHLFSGEHLSDIGKRAQNMNREQKKYVETNQNSRYHYITFGPDITDPPISIIDFKHYFTISLSYLEENLKKRIFGINPLYRELISQRFSNYLCRIGLPPIQIEDT